MGNYSTEVRTICQSFTKRPDNKPTIGTYGSSGNFYSIDETVEMAASHIFNFKYPIFDFINDEEYDTGFNACNLPTSTRTPYKIYLEKKILKHYYTREISEETFGLWKLRLNIKMNEIMPYYNQMYMETFEKYGILNPFNDVDLSDTSDADNSSNTSGANTSNISGEDRTEHISGYTDETETSETTTQHSDSDSGKDYSRKYSDTPQGATSNLTDGYLTNYTKDSETNNQSSDSSQNSVATVKNKRIFGDGTSSNPYSIKNIKGTNNNSVFSQNGEINSHVLRTIVGKRSSISYAKILKELRETFLNVDMKIIEELSVLFFGLWE